MLFKKGKLSFTILVMALVAIMIIFAGCSSSVDTKTPGTDEAKESAADAKDLENADDTDGNTGTSVENQNETPESVWEDPNFFPIAVWLQNTSNAMKYKSIGINVYVGLNEGPTEEQLTALAQSGIKLICEQNEAGLKHIDNENIIAWAQMDEPDNAQPDGNGGWGAPIDPSVVVEKYNTWKAKDPSRPVYLNLGCGVSWKEWIGRGVDTGKMEKYPEYIKGTDIISFDIYPANVKDPAVRNNLWYVPQGIDNLRKWSNDEKPVWTWIETTKIDENSPAGPTPEQVRSEVWMALIHGAKGIGYFCHTWTPAFSETGPLNDLDMQIAIATINLQITSLAPVLNSPAAENKVEVKSSNKDIPIDIMVKEYNGEVYVFAVAMRDGIASGTFHVPSGSKVEVIGEKRQLDIADGSFKDSFESYGVHLYKITD